MQFLCKAAAWAGVKTHHCHKKTAEYKALEGAFQQHMVDHGLSYGTKEEYEFRYELYAAKDAAINKVNAEEANFQLGHNKFSTWTDAEYKAILGARRAEPKNVVELPETNEDSVDWRTKGAVNPIKDQARCGSCWAFSATAAVEGAHFLKTGELLSLSEQQVVSCDHTSYGCNGGWQYSAFEYLEKTAQELEADYPYTSGTGSTGTCKADAKKEKIFVSSYNNVKADSVAQLKAAIATAPTSVTIEADKLVFQMYTYGIMDSTSCGTNLDHAVAAVGYGTDEASGKEYYIVRNSWGTSWGDQGYIKIAAVDGKGICGIQEQSLYPLAKN